MNIFQLGILCNNKFETMHNLRSGVLDSVSNFVGPIDQQAIVSLQVPVSCRISVVPPKVFYFKQEADTPCTEHILNIILPKVC